MGSESTFTSDAGGEVWLLPLGGSAPYSFLQTSATELSPHFSPDGALLAYLSDEAGALDVYVSEFPRGSRIKVSTGGGVELAWSADGKSLFFINQDRQIATADVGRSPLRVSRPRDLLPAPFTVSFDAPCRNYDPLPDGSGFVMVEHTSELLPPREIRVVTGWFDELEEKTGSRQSQKIRGRASPRRRGDRRAKTTAGGPVLDARAVRR